LGADIGGSAIIKCSPQDLLSETKVRVWFAYGIGTATAGAALSRLLRDGTIAAGQ
jgi:hypothetical protein